MTALDSYTDEDFKQTMRGAIRLEAILCLIAVGPVAWKMGWASGALLAVGALISGSSLWEWLRLMSALMLSMDAGDQAKPMTMVLVGFFVRLGVAVAMLYGSLKLLNGSVYALAAGLGLGVFCLTIKAIPLMKTRAV